MSDIEGEDLSVTEKKVKVALTRCILAFVASILERRDLDEMTELTDYLRSKREGN